MMRSVLAIVLSLAATGVGAAEPPVASQPLAPLAPDDSAPPQSPTQPQTKIETFEDGDTIIQRSDEGEKCRAQVPARFGQDLRSVIFLDPAELQDCQGRRIDTYAALDGDTNPAVQDQCLAPQSVCNTLAQALDQSKQRRRTVLRSDGWIDVMVVTKGDATQASAPLRYTIVLHTNQSHLTVDLRALTSMLNDLATN